jgi:hypothetical protein
MSCKSESECEREDGDLPLSRPPQNTNRDHDMAGKAVNRKMVRCHFTHLTQDHSYDAKNGKFLCPTMNVRKRFHHDPGEGDGKGSPLPFPPEKSRDGMAGNKLEC